MLSRGPSHSGITEIGISQTVTQTVTHFMHDSLTTDTDRQSLSVSNTMNTIVYGA